MVRGHGEGSVYQRKDGRWVAEITLEDHSRKQFYARTKKEAIELRRVAINDLKKGTLPIGPDQTLEAFLNHWVENVYKPSVRPATYVQFRYVINKHLIPAFGRIILRKLTPEQIEKFYAKKLVEGLAPRTINIIHSALRKSLDHAVIRNLVSRNVAKLVTPPRVVRHEIQPLTEEQARHLIEVARGHRLEAMIMVAVVTGMRRGELMALRWSDVDLTRGFIQVKRSVGRLGGYGHVENEPKTKSSRRSIMLPDVIVNVLREHKVKQNEIRVVAGDKWHEQGLVFPNILGGFLEGSNIFVWLRALAKDADLPPMRFHDLRHSAATILLVKGVHPKVVQELLGHSKIATTMDVYSHVMPSMQRDAMDKMNDVFKEQ